MLKSIFLVLFLVFQIQCLSKPLELNGFWKIFGYEIDGVQYLEDTDREYKIGAITFDDKVEENDKFLIVKNLVPYSIVSRFWTLIFTIPRTRPGIPFSLNFLQLDVIDEGSPVAQPYPNSKDSRDIVSVYGLYQSACRMLVWFVDTGYIDVPGARKQVKAPEIMAYTPSNTLFHRFIIDTKLLQDGVTSGLRSLIVDHILPCTSSYVYVSDEYANTVIVYSLEDKQFHKITRASTDGEAWSFPVPFSIVRFLKNVIKYRKTPKETFEHYTAVLNSETGSSSAVSGNSLKGLDEEIYPHGVLYQWGFNADILLFTNVDRTSIFCWNMNTDADENNVDTVLQLTNEDGNSYIADIEVLGLSFKLLLNRIRSPDTGVYDEKINNFLYSSGDINEILKDTKCVLPNNCTESVKKLSESYRVLLSYKNIPKYITEDYADWFARKFNRGRPDTSALRENC